MCFTNKKLLTSNIIFLGKEDKEESDTEESKYQV